MDDLILIDKKEFLLLIKEKYNKGVTIKTDIDEYPIEEICNLNTEGKIKYICYFLGGTPYESLDLIAEKLFDYITVSLNENIIEIY